MACDRDTAVLRIVKLGGAAITDKTGFETLNEDVLAAASGVARGGIEAAAVRIGFAATRASVSLLNNIVCQALLREGLPAVGISPCSSGLWTTSNRELVSDGSQAVGALCAAGLLPVMHGDAVLDRALGCTILSGDTLLTALCAALRPPLAVFLTNVAGIYDRPPELPGARLISRIEVSESVWVATCSDGGRIVDLHTVSAAGDTTGGIATKLREAQAAALQGVEVRIAEAGTPHAAAALGSGPLPLDWVGTSILRVP